MNPGVSTIRAFIRKYRSLLSLGAAFLSAELAYAVLNLSALPVYVKYTLNEESALGFIISAFLLSEALSKPGFGVLGDRIGRKPLLIAGPLVTAITAYVTIKLHGPYAVYGLIGLRIIDGLGSGALVPTAFAAIGDVVDEEHHSAAMSMLNVTYMSGLALGFLVGGGVNELFHSYLASFYLVSILFFITVIILFFAFPKRIGGPHYVSHHDHVELTTHEEPAEFKLSHLIRSFREVPDMVVLSCVVFLGIGILMPVIKLYAMEHLGLSETQFGIAVAPIAAAMGIFAVPLGRLGDKYGKCVAVCWGILGSAIAMWVLALFRSIILAGLAGIIIGLGFTIGFPAWMALVASATSSSRRGEVLGAVGGAQGIAAIIGAAAGGIIYSSDRLSFPRLGVVNYNVPFWFAAILLSIGAVLSFTWVCKRNCERDTGDGIRPWQRRMVIIGAVIGFISLSIWIGFRYTRPVAPDRVTWEWVQQLFRGRSDKALKFTVDEGPAGWSGSEESNQYARKFYGWKKHRDARYTVRMTESSSDTHASVPVSFVLMKPKEDITVHIILCKQHSGEWKICGIHEEKQ